MFYPNAVARQWISIAYNIVFIISTILLLAALYFLHFQKSMTSKTYKILLTLQLVIGFTDDITAISAHFIVIPELAVFFLLTPIIPSIGFNIFLAAFFFFQFHLNHGVLFLIALYKFTSLYPEKIVVRRVLIVLAFTLIVMLDFTLEYFFYDLYSSGQCIIDVGLICARNNLPCEPEMPFMMQCRLTVYQLKIMAVVLIVLILLCLTVIGCVSIFFVYFSRHNKTVMSSKTRQIHRYLSKLLLLQCAIVFVCEALPMSFVTLAFINFFQSDFISRGWLWMSKASDVELVNLKN
ncbi:unnamed protein product, partial [Mesorhabditis belari]|uniref:Uncharacterized protein n=1 Tax=Mesorhabditis belari TaxID=2138241 RepID=A0AAF3EU20_9BILA